MNIRRLALFALMLLLCALGSAAVACGGGDGEQAALEQYFQSAQSLDVAYEDQYDLFQRRLDAELAAATEEEEALEPLRNNFGANLAIFTDFVSGLENLAAPDSVKDAHDAAIDALRIYLDRLQEAKEQLAEADSVSELQAIYTAEDLDAANDQAVRTCIALQNIATKIGIEIDIGCLD
ncbi:MAG: hypothetical protein IH866_04625 [Chloroflexi bacterium]|nr:hypothetical protein [Chloroflexota bacterium]